MNSQDSSVMVHARTLQVEVAWSLHEVIAELISYEEDPTWVSLFRRYQMVGSFCVASG